MKIGYRRVSSEDQNLDRQDLGTVDKVFEEKLSGASTVCAVPAPLGFRLRAGSRCVRLAFLPS